MRLLWLRWYVLVHAWHLFVCKIGKRMGKSFLWRVRRTTKAMTAFKKYRELKYGDELSDDNLYLG